MRAWVEAVRVEAATARVEAVLVAIEAVSVTVEAGNQIEIAMIAQVSFANIVCNFQTLTPCILYLLCLLLWYNLLC